ncbi:hypothetical protein RRG08_003358 [Elysia crispata]|uniref:EGF-like domain-containing protein n=1 Tax=Elysia crispata TaxID=231223 RepID=A0AAE0YC75_9GAST|nr:hypothetical protein RRG08_003358 [Elysia crispata]
MQPVKICGHLVFVAISLICDCAPSTPADLDLSGINAPGQELFERPEDCLGRTCGRFVVSRFKRTAYGGGTASSRVFRGMCSDLKGVCHHRCIGVSKTHYKCACRHGYELLSNQRSCWRHTSHAHSRTATLPGSTQGKRGGRYKTRFTSHRTTGSRPFLRRSYTSHRTTGSRPFLRRSYTSHRTTGSRPFLRRSYTSRLLKPGRYKNSEELVHKAKYRPQLSKNIQNARRNLTQVSQKRLKPVHNRETPYKEHSISTSNLTNNYKPQTEPITDSKSEALRKSVRNNRFGQRSSVHKRQRNIRPGYQASRLSLYRQWTNKRRMAAKTYRKTAKISSINVIPGHNKTRKRWTPSMKNSQASRNEKSYHLWRGDAGKSRSNAQSDRGQDKTSFASGSMGKSRKTKENNTSQKLQNKYNSRPERKPSEEQELSKSMQADEAKLERKDKIHASVVKKPSSLKSSSLSPSSTSASTSEIGKGEDVKGKKEELQEIQFATKPTHLQLSKELNNQTLNLSPRTKQEFKKQVKTIPDKSTAKQVKTTAFVYHTTKLSENQKPEKGSQFFGQDKLTRNNETSTKLTRSGDSRENSPKQLSKKSRVQNKLFLRQKMLSNMQEQFLDPRLAALLKKLRKQKPSSSQTTTTMKKEAASSIPSKNSQSLRPTLGRGGINQQTTVDKSRTLPPQQRQTNTPRALSTHPVFHGEQDKEVKVAQSTCPMVDLAINYRHRLGVFPRKHTMDKTRRTKSRIVLNVTSTPEVKGFHSPDILSEARDMRKTAIAQSKLYKTSRIHQLRKSGLSDSFHQRPSGIEALQSILYQPREHKKNRFHETGFDDLDPVLGVPTKMYGDKDGGVRASKRTFSDSERKLQFAGEARESPVTNVTHQTSFKQKIFMTTDIPKQSVKARQKMDEAVFSLDRTFETSPKNEQASTFCPPGQTVILTPEGKRCGFKSGQWIASLGVPKCGAFQIQVQTQQGLQCINFKDLREDQNPCPPKQKLTKNNSGGLECTYFDDVIVHITPEADGKCGGKGEMLVQTSTGFFCRRVKEAAIDLPACPELEIFVKTNLGFECIDKNYASLRCNDGFLLRRDINGFHCNKEPRDLPAMSTPVHPSGQVCRPGEVLVTEGGVLSCRRLELSYDLCGAGFKPKPSAEDGTFVCAPEKKNILDCPAGYYRSESGAECLPLAPHVDLCKDPQFQELFGRQVDCTSGNLSAILVPCEEGYELDQVSKAGSTEPLCSLIDYVDIVCEEDQSCRTERHRKCDRDRAGADSPCLALLRKVWTGCQPQCANGGSCHGDACVCPLGLMGKACEEDVNECEAVEEHHCENGCVNTFGSFHCACPFGYTLNSDRRSCKAIDCIPDCLNGGVCEDGLCLCPVGLEGDRCQSDVDECQTGSHGCQGYCRNTFGSYRCLCGAGLELGVDGRSCAPRSDSCSVKCRNGGSCQNHRCACPPGFYGIACQLDVNECLNRDNGCSHKCENIRGGYRCICPTGLALLPDGKTCRKIIRSR